MNPLRPIILITFISSSWQLATKPPTKLFLRGASGLSFYPKPRTIVIERPIAYGQAQAEMLEYGHYGTTSVRTARRDFLKFLAASPYVAALGGVTAFLDA